MREEQKGFGLLLDACLLPGKVFVNKEQALFNFSEGMIVGQQIKVVSLAMGIELPSLVSERQRNVALPKLLRCYQGAQLAMLFLGMHAESPSLMSPVTL